MTKPFKNDSRKKKKWEKCSSTRHCPPPPAPRAGAEGAGQLHSHFTHCISRHQVLYENYPLAQPTTNLERLNHHPESKQSQLYDTYFRVGFALTRKSNLVCNCVRSKFSDLATVGTHTSVSKFS